VQQNNIPPAGWSGLKTRNFTVTGHHAALNRFNHHLLLPAFFSIKIFTDNIYYYANKLNAQLQHSSD